MDDMKVRHCNWVRFLKTSANLGDVNMIGVKVKGEVIYQTTETILPNEEIVAFLETADACMADQTRGNSDDNVGSLVPNLAKGELDIDTVLNSHIKARKIHGLYRSLITANDIKRI